MANDFCPISKDWQEKSVALAAMDFHNAENLARFLGY